MPVTFKSAGTSAPLKADRSDDGNTDDDHDDNGIGNSEIHGEGDTPETEEIKDGPNNGTDNNQIEIKGKKLLHEASPAVDSLFYYDTGPGAPGANRDSGNSSPAPKVQAMESERSDSEGEVILFKGRVNTKGTNTDTINLKNIRTEIAAVERELEQPPVAFDATMIPDTKSQRKQGRGNRGGRLVKAKADIPDLEDDDILADYIANMRASGEMHDILSAKEGNIDSIETDNVCTDDSDDNSGDERESLTGTAAVQKTGCALNPSLTQSMSEISDFDPMDWERPSLRRRKRKGADQKLYLRFAGLDSETEQRLQTAFRTDRAKKADRKREREQLRSMNLLGKKNGDAEDLRSKYPRGMRLDQVAKELKGFLLSIENRYVPSLTDCVRATD